VESAVEKLSLLDFCSQDEYAELMRLERLLGPDPDPGSPKRRRFVEEYCVDFHAMRAYIRAGYRKGSAATNAYNLLHDPSIQYQILRRKISMRARAEVSAERVVSELAHIAFSNIADYLVVDEDGQCRVDVTGVDREQMAAVQELTFEETEHERDGSTTTRRRTKIRLHDKLAALEKLMRYLGIDKKQVMIELTQQTIEGSVQSETPARELIAGRLAGIAERARASRGSGQPDGEPAS
jgi:phage terminase small subunit